MWVLGKNGPLLKAGIEGCVGETMSRMKNITAMYRRVGSVAWLSKIGSVDGRYQVVGNLPSKPGALSRTVVS